MRTLSSVCLAVAFVACGTQPAIVNTEVSPASWEIGGIADTATFTLTTDVLHLGGRVTSVTARVQGMDQTFTLSRVGDVLGGERWSVSTNMTLWSGMSSGTYTISITATDDDGTSVTDENAVTITIRD